ncbi:MAG: DUF1016 family protein [Bacteroidales bacterium]|nr:DUF1016 family protein [Bacteroidales bacterium]
MLEYYWSLGRDIVRQEAESRWGSGFFNQLSLDMKAMFPNETGFSVTNLKYMKRWYVFYTEDVTIRQRVVDEIEMPSQFGLIPWGQHIDIFTRCESKKRALFYIEKSIENGWSRPQLNSQIDNNLFERQGAADNLLRGKDDNPSVGLLICKTAKKTIVEWSLKDINKPLGIATYQLQEVVERTIAEIEEANKKK